MFTPEEADKINAFVEAGHYKTNSELVRDAVEKLVARLESGGK